MSRAVDVVFEMSKGAHMGFEARIRLDTMSLFFFFLPLRELNALIETERINPARRREPRAKVEGLSLSPLEPSSIPSVLPAPGGGGGGGGPPSALFCFLLNGGFSV